MATSKVSNNDALFLARAESITAGTDDPLSLDASASASNQGGSVKRRWSIQVENDGTQTTGTLTLQGRLPGATEFQDVATVDMNAPAPGSFVGVFEALNITQASYDGTTYAVYLAAVPE